ncbi:MAG TPA: WecB/TagA/CpsF family glycosyltransferase [Fervidobacterium sp.]|nr:WecB/TagA/CpsF family glycosyltransferase [Fervidobacterium sp.]HPT54072.1 WecB/TagA/CpsF family glycosyltransferase [Fervidobacterium sp.]HPZ17169.1 WecB/TagA/CpsF family glycosyltransferase [Fervidobacterium sp.]HUM41922.1 WecB/TagA/CpsF family glycosyltransferase [Fervidobacterium sp.]
MYIMFRKPNWEGINERVGGTDPVFLNPVSMVVEHLTKIDFYNYKILCGGASEIRNHLVSCIENGDKMFVVTLNSQIFLRALELSEYDDALKNATFHLPDGAGVVWAIKKHCKVVTDRVPGIDTMQYLCEESKSRKWKVYLLGGKPDAVKKAAEKLSESGVNIVGYHHGYFTDETPSREIEETKPDLLFVGMGAPRQEFWIHDHIDLPFKLAMGVGGSFDVIAGMKKRAPRLLQKMRLEWFYRWITDPISRSGVPVDVLKFYFKVIFDGKNGNCKEIH